LSVGVPAFTRLAPSDEEIEQLLEARVDLTIFLRMLTDDEMADRISKVDPLPDDYAVRDVGPQASRGLPSGSSAPRSGQFQGHAPRDFRTVQDEIEGEGDGFDS
jgi:hypothetical protein